MRGQVQVLGAFMAATVLALLLKSRMVQQTTDVEALSSSSRPEGQRRPHRILCYGDSLTAGTSPPRPALFPYAPHLQAALRQNDWPVQVRHVGLPGWTAEQMTQTLGDSSVGLQTAIRSVSDPSLSIVILLAGTNDLGHGFEANDIVENVKALHEATFKAGVPHTVAIAVPPSGYQSRVETAAATVAQVNQELQAFAEQQQLPNRTTTFVPFPFDFEPNGENWAPDTLHFSPKGYQVLAKSLAPAIIDILESLEKEEMSNTSP